MEEQVAELAGRLLAFAGVGGIDELVGLLQRVGDDVVETLLTVPGALAAQYADDTIQLQQVSGQSLAAAGLLLSPQLVIAFPVRYVYSPAVVSVLPPVVVSSGL